VQRSGLGIGFLRFVVGASGGLECGRVFLDIGDTRHHGGAYSDLRQWCRRKWG